MRMRYILHVLLCVMLIGVSCSKSNEYLPDDPEYPVSPVDPEIIDTIHMPDSLDNPEVPDSLGKPEVPDSLGNPETPDSLEVPEVPDSLDVPDNPDVPGEPDDPGIPDNPVVPDNPIVPDNPDIPDDPDVPDVPDVPADPLLSAMLADPVVVTSDILTAGEITQAMYGGLPFGSGDMTTIIQQIMGRIADRAAAVADAARNDGATNYYRRVRFNYTSIDESGREILLSGVAAWNCQEKDGEPVNPLEGIELCCPYTQFANSECISVAGGRLEMKKVFDRVLFIMPDYEGFGVSVSRDQVYINHDVHARQAYDALMAGYKVFRDLDGRLKDGFTMVASGGSQGAANAIALQKYMEETYGNGGTYADLWHFDHSNVCCGPYSPSATMQEYYDAGYVSLPMVLPLTIRSMINSYPVLLGAIDESRFFSSKYNAHKLEIDRVLRDKSMTITEVGNYIASLLGSTSSQMPLTDILSEEALDPSSDLHKTMLQCLAYSDLTNGWTPRHRVKAMYCKTDEIVPYRNSQMLQEFLGSKGKFTRAVTTNHAATIMYWILTQL